MIWDILREILHVTRVTLNITKVTFNINKVIPVKDIIRCHGNNRNGCHYSEIGRNLDNIK